MSVKDYNKSLIISDCLTGTVIDTIPIIPYSINTLRQLLGDILEDYCITDDRGFMVKVGYNS